MKIQCDVCTKEEALLFCSADEAALCSGCDHSVHHANKLASKHHRFSLLHPSAKDAPRCDICLESRALLFCQQHRSILCRECDLSTHKANEHTSKHKRFLLTGVKLSSFSSSNSSDASKAKKPISLSPQLHEPNTTTTTTTSITTSKVENSLVSEVGFTSSISEYIEMLPGWHVEEFLDSFSAPSHGFSKNDDLMPFLDTDMENNLNFSSNDLAIWVSQIAQAPLHLLPQESKEVMNVKVSRKERQDGFLVPQISHPGAKRPRNNLCL